MATVEVCSLRPNAGMWGSNWRQCRAPQLRSNYDVNLPSAEFCGKWSDVCILNRWSLNFRPQPRARRRLSGVLTIMPSEGCWMIFPLMRQRAYAHDSKAYLSACCSFRLCHLGYTHYVHLPRDARESKYLRGTRDVIWASGSAGSALSRYLAT